MELLKYTFICPNCNDEHYTYIERKHYIELTARIKSIDNIFDNFPKDYVNIFKIGFCNKCQKELLNYKYVNNYCLSIDNSINDSNLYDKIYDLYERQ